MQNKVNAGDVLVETNMLSRQQLDDARTEASKTGLHVLKCLVVKKYINEGDVASTLSSKFGFPYVDLSNVELDSEIVKLVPADIAKKYLLIPVDRGGDAVTVFMADPFDSEAISEVAKASGLQVQPFVGVISDIERAIKYNYDGDKSVLSAKTSAGKKDGTEDRPEESSGGPAVDSAALEKALSYITRDVAGFQNAVSDDIAFLEGQFAEIAERLQALSARVNGIKKQLDAGSG